MEFIANNIVTILAGETKLASDFIGKIPGKELIFSEIYCDSAFCKFSARTAGNTTGLVMDRSIAGIYGASNAKTLIASTGIVYGPFDALYVDTISDPIRVQIKAVE